MNVLDALLDFLLNFYGNGLYALIFGILLACGLGIPIPEDITLFCSGVLAYYGLIDVRTTIVICFLGVLLGDATVFWLGAHYGRKITKKWFFQKILPEERLNYVRDNLLKKHGNKIIFAARFMPGLRAPLYFSAGTLHVPFRVFLFYDGLAALVSVPLIIYVVYRFGGEVDSVIRKIKSIEQAVVVAIIVIAVFSVLKWLKRRRTDEI